MPKPAIRALGLTVALFAFGASAQARIKNAPCTIADARTCRVIQSWMDNAAQAVFTSVMAGQLCPDLATNVPLVESIVVQYGGYIDNEHYGDVRQMVASKFREDPARSCRLAYELYGPGGTAIVRGDRNLPVTGLVRRKSTGGFLDQR